MIAWPFSKTTVTKVYQIKLYCHRQKIVNFSKPNFSWRNSNRAYENLVFCCLCTYFCYNLEVIIYLIVYRLSTYRTFSQHN